MDLTLIETLDRQKKREASRRLAVASILLTASVILSLAAAGATKMDTAPPVSSDATYSRLQAEQRQQAEQLNRLRQLFTYCRSSVHWGDIRCVDPTVTLGRTITVTQPAPTSDESDSSDSSDNSSDDGSDTRIVVVTPTPRESKKSAHPNPTTNPEPNAGHGRDSHKNHREPVGNGRK